MVTLTSAVKMDPVVGKALPFTVMVLPGWAAEGLTDKIFTWAEASVAQAVAANRPNHRFQRRKDGTRHLRDPAGGQLLWAETGPPPLRTGTP